MTLQEILPAVRQLPPKEQVELLRVLEQEQSIPPDEAGRVYYLHTPVDCYGAAELMLQELERFKAENPL